MSGSRVKNSFDYWSLTNNSLPLALPFKEVGDNVTTFVVSSLI